MLKKMMKNRKILVAFIIVLFFAVCVTLFVVTTKDSNKDGNAQMERTENESSEGLDVVDPDEEQEEPESDTSDYWEEDVDKDNDTTIDNSSSDEAKTDSDSTKVQDDTSVDENENGDSENVEILQDDTVWGEVR